MELYIWIWIHSDTGSLHMQKVQIQFKYSIFFKYSLFSHEPKYLKNVMQNRFLKCLIYCFFVRFDFFPPRIPLVSTCMFEGCDGSKNMHINVYMYDAINVYIILTEEYDALKVPL